MTAKTNALTVVDNDAGEITILRNGKEIRGWSYKNPQEQLIKMMCAREYLEGWYDGGISQLQDQIDK